MAPVVISSTGIPRQTIDSPELISLIERLSTFDPKTKDVVFADDAGMDIDKDDAAGHKVGDSPPLDIVGLVDELKKYQRWRFQEQVSFQAVLIQSRYNQSKSVCYGLKMKRNKIINNLSLSHFRPIFTNGHIH